MQRQHQRQPGNVSRPFCLRCENHGERVPFKYGHLRVCPHLKCKCRRCLRSASVLKSGWEKAGKSERKKRDVGDGAIRYCVFCSSHGMRIYANGQHFKFCKFRDCQCSSCIGARKKEEAYCVFCGLHGRRVLRSEKHARYCNALSCLCNLCKGERNRIEKSSKIGQKSCVKAGSEVSSGAPDQTIDEDVAVQEVTSASNTTEEEGSEEVSHIVEHEAVESKVTEITNPLPNCLYCSIHGFAFPMKKHHFSFCCFRQCRCDGCRGVRRKAKQEKSSPDTTTSSSHASDDVQGDKTASDSVASSSDGVQGNKTADSAASSSLASDGVQGDNTSPDSIASASQPSDGVQGDTTSSFRSASSPQASDGVQDDKPSSDSTASASLPSDGDPGDKTLSVSTVSSSQPSDGIQDDKTSSDSTASSPQVLDGVQNDKASQISDSDETSSGSIASSTQPSDGDNGDEISSVSAASLSQPSDGVQGASCAVSIAGETKKPCAVVAPAVRRASRELLVAPSILNKGVLDSNPETSKSDSCSRRDSASRQDSLSETGRGSCVKSADVYSNNASLNVVAETETLDNELEVPLRDVVCAEKNSSNRPKTDIAVSDVTVNDSVTTTSKSRVDICDPSIAISKKVTEVEASKIQSDSVDNEKGTKNLTTFLGLPGIADVRIQSDAHVSAENNISTSDSNPGTVNKKSSMPEIYYDLLIDLAALGQNLQKAIPCTRVINVPRQPAVDFEPAGNATNNSNELSVKSAHSDIGRVDHTPDGNCAKQLTTEESSGPGGNDEQSDDPDVTLEEILCEKCGLTWDNSHQLRLHGYLRHGFDCESAPGKVYRCRVCSMEDESEAVIFDHESTAHMGLVPLSKLFNLISEVCNVKRKHADKNEM